MKIGLYGGTFDPIHCGHILPVLEARERLGLGRVVYLPTAQPPHKPGRQFAAPHRRYLMVELALLDQEGLYVSPHELTLDRPAYTVDSVEYFHRKYPDDELVLLIGGDSFAKLTEWRRWADIVAIARPAVLMRPGWELERIRATLPGELESLVADGGVDFVANQPVEVSSTELRRILGRGEEPPPGVVPPLVVEYARKYSLYR